MKTIHPVQEFFRQAMDSVPSWRERRYLVAVSGGMDSMVLAHLMQAEGLNFALVHCNFALRGADSDADEQLVRKAAKQYGKRVFVRRCPVESGNVQTEARRLRYAFFDGLMQAHGFDYLLTAHHGDDSVETFFINLLRGTGLRGLTGIRDRERILRPLRKVLRRDLADYAAAYGVRWREDASNASDKYVRNRIRHEILPLLEQINPAFRENMLRTMERLAWEEAVAGRWFEELKPRVVEPADRGESCDLSRLPEEPLDRWFLARWLGPHGFHDLQAVYRLAGRRSGGVLYSPDGSKALYVRNGKMVWEAVPVVDSAVYYLDPKRPEMAPPWLKWQILSRAEAEAEDFRHASPELCYLDADKLRFPLELRPWRAGDRFVPLGMRGRKKVGDFLTDLKVPVHRRRDVYVVLSEGEPVCLAGYRPDGRFAVDEGTRRVLRMQFPA